MAKQTIKIGGRELEIDALTRDDLHAELELVLSGFLRPPLEVRPENGVVLDNTGAGIASIYRAKAGMQFRLTRVFVTVNGATFGVPLTGLTGGIDIYRSSGNANDPLDGTTFPSTSAPSSLPQVATWNRANAPLFRDGEELRVGIVGGPAGGQMFVRAAGFLEPITLDADN